MNFNGLFKFRIAQRQKRQALQISRKNGKPDSSKSENRANIHQAGNSARCKFGTGQPKEIDEAHENEPHRDFGQQFGAALDVARKKEKERREKVKDKDEDGDDAPASVKPGAIETDFFRQIAGPDDEELRKTEIGPQHDESEQELAQVVQVAALDEAFHGRGAREQDEDGDHQRHRRDQLTYDEEETVDRRSPVWRKRHDPVDGSERHDEDIKDDSGACNHFQAAA